MYQQLPALSGSRAELDLHHRLLSFASTLRRPDPPTLCGTGGPYLHRFLIDVPDEKPLRLHYFVRPDEDLELHDHPWGDPNKPNDPNEQSVSLILLGGYDEERLEGTTIARRIYRRGDLNYIHSTTFHRIDRLHHDFGCWTLFRTAKYYKSWGFWDRNTDVYTPSREFIAAKGLSL